MLRSLLAAFLVATIPALTANMPDEDRRAEPRSSNRLTRDGSDCRRRLKEPRKGFIDPLAAAILLNGADEKAAALRRMSVMPQTSGQPDKVCPNGQGLVLQSAGLAVKDGTVMTMLLPADEIVAPLSYAPVPLPKGARAALRPKLRPYKLAYEGSDYTHSEIHAAIQFAWQTYEKERSTP